MAVVAVHRVSLDEGRVRAACVTDGNVLWCGSTLHVCRTGEGWKADDVIGGVYIRAFGLKVRVDL